MPSSEQDSPRAIGVTGAGGYLGSHLVAYLCEEGHIPRALSRSSGNQPNARRFRLGDAPDPEDLAGLEALIHCAHDFTVDVRDDAQDVNVLGAKQLLKAAAEAGVGRVVFISTISAFVGCRSVYGRRKLVVEDLVRSAGGVVVRPGLIYGDPSGGMFGRLEASVRKLPVVPLIGRGDQLQYLVHVRDLCALLVRLGTMTAPPAKPVIAAARTPLSFREILETLAGRHGKRRWFVPVPASAVLLGLRLAEVLALGLSFRSDSVVSLLNQNPNPAFDSGQALLGDFRDFRSWCTGTPQPDQPMGSEF